MAVQTQTSSSAHSNLQLTSEVIALRSKVIETDHSYIPFPFPVPGFNQQVKGSWVKETQTQELPPRSDLLIEKIPFKVDRKASMHDRSCQKVFNDPIFLNELRTKHGQAWKEIHITSQKNGQPTVKLDGNILMIGLPSDKNAIQRLQASYSSVEIKVSPQNEATALIKSLFEHASIRGALDLNRRQLDYAPYASRGFDSPKCPTSFNYSALKDLSEELGILIKFADKKGGGELYADFLKSLSNCIKSYQEQQPFKLAILNKLSSNLDLEFRAFHQRYIHAVENKTEISLDDRTILALSSTAFCQSGKITQLVKKEAKDLLNCVRANLEQFPNSLESLKNKQDLLVQTWSANYTLAGLARIFAEGNNLDGWIHLLTESVSIYCEKIRMVFEKELFFSVKNADLSLNRDLLVTLKEHHQRLAGNSEIFDFHPKTFDLRINQNELAITINIAPIDESEFMGQIYTLILDPEKSNFDKLELICNCLRPHFDISGLNSRVIFRRNIIRTYALLPYSGQETLQQLYNILELACQKEYQQSFQQYAEKLLIMKIGKEADQASDQFLCRVIKEGFPFFMELMIREIRAQLEENIKDEPAIALLDYFLDFPDSLAEIDPNSPYAAHYALEALELAFNISLDLGDVPRSCHYYSRINNFCLSANSQAVSQKASKFRENCESNLKELIDGLIESDGADKLEKLDRDFSFANISNAFQFIDQLAVFASLPIDKFPQALHFKLKLKNCILKNNNLRQKIDQTFKELKPYITGLTDPSSVAREYLQGTMRILEVVRELKILSQMLFSNKDWLGIPEVTLEKLNLRIDELGKHVE